MKPVVVAVSGIHGGASPQAGVGLAAALARLREEGRVERLLGLAENPLDSGAHEAGLFDQVLLTDPADPERLSADLERLTRSIPLDLLVPGRVSHVAAVSGAAGRLERLGIRALVPGAGELELMSPEGLFLEGRRRGLALHDGHGAEDRPRGPEYEVAVLSDRSAVPRLALAVRRLDGDDTTWAAVSVDDEGLRDHALRTAARLRCPGICTLRFQSAGGHLGLVAWAPCPPAWIGLTAAAGSDLALALVRVGLGEEPGVAERLRPGLLWTRRAVDRPASLGRLAALTLSTLALTALPLAAPSLSPTGATA